MSAGPLAIIIGLLFMAILFGLAAWLWRRSVSVPHERLPGTEVLPRELPALHPSAQPRTELLPVEPATELLPAELTERVERAGPKTAVLDDDDDGTIFTPRQQPAQHGPDEDGREGWRRGEPLG